VNSTDNYFTAADGTNRLQCVSDTQANMLFIYGLARDIDVSELGSENNSLDIQLKIKSFESPEADYPTS